MMFSGNMGDIKAELSRIRKEQQTVEQAISGYQRESQKIADMGFYRLKKQRTKLREEFIKLNGMLYPDTIA